MRVDSKSEEAKAGLEESERQLAAREASEEGVLDRDAPAPGPGTESRQSRGKNDRWHVGNNPVDWHDSLRRGIGRDPKKVKQKLYSDEKSRQRVKTELDRINSVGDAVESPVTKSIEENLEAGGGRRIGLLVTAHEG